MLWVCLSSARTRKISTIKRNSIQLSTGRILGENQGQSPFQVQSPFQQTLGDKVTLKQDNNLKHKAKSTQELLTKMTLNVSEKRSIHFGLKSPRNLQQDLKMTF
jgi:hypothetical protein